MSPTVGAFLHVHDKDLPSNCAAFVCMTPGRKECDGETMQDSFGAGQSVFEGREHQKCFKKAWLSAAI